MSATRVGTRLLGAGSIIQTQYFQTGALVSGSTAIPYDDTIPQVSEGFEVMTLAITPAYSTSLLLVEAVINAAISEGSGPSPWLVAALFRDGAGNDALATAMQGLFMSSSVTAGGQQPNMLLRHQMTAGSTSAVTFRVRIGESSGSTVNFNGDYNSAVRRFGGTYASSIRITEIAA